MGGVREEFAYDGLNRLLTATTKRGTATLRTLTTGYGTDKLGNYASMSSSVTTDTSVTGIGYGGGSKPADGVTSATIGGDAYTLKYDAAGNVTHYDRTAGDDRYIDWDARNLAVRVTVGDSRTDTTPTARDAFRYGPSRGRYYRSSTWGGATTRYREETFYVGAFEELVYTQGRVTTSLAKTRVTDALLHVRTTVTTRRPDPQTGAETATTATPTKRLAYLHRDVLGSVVAVTELRNRTLSSWARAYDPYEDRCWTV